MYGYNSNFLFILHPKTKAMRTPYFTFKQFSIRHDRCAMKVGTDGVLLGAWCSVPLSGSVLDIGTGTALIAIMAAQRGAGRVEGVEIEPSAASQAAENVASTPWSGHVQILHADFLAFAASCTQHYDLIVSNPPYFEASMLPPTAGRQLARHTDSLSYESLIERAASLLSPQGRLSLIFPADVEAKLQQIAQGLSLHLVRRSAVRGRANGDVKRILAEWQFMPETLIDIPLTIELARHQYSPEYIALTREFYLNM